MKDARRKITIKLSPIPEQKPFRCDVCGESHDRWKCYIEGRKRKLCLDCSNKLTPLKSRLGWRHHEHFSHKDACAWGDIHHLVIMLGAS